MKCQNCGAEINGNSKFCEFCGSPITSQMRREREQINKDGCPKCGSSNISFTREKQGEIKGKRGTAIVRSTVGVCKDCGYTWQTDDGTANATKKKKRIWLWVLGWIYIFPLPLTILLLRKKEMKPGIKYGIIAAAWLIPLLLMIIAGISGETTDLPANSGENIATTSVQENIESVEEKHIYENAEIKDIFNGFRTEKIGEYSVIRVSSTECTESALADWYYNFVKGNDYNFNIILFTDKEDNKGCYAINSMVEVGTSFVEDEYGDYTMGNTQGSVIYAPAGDGKTLIKLEFNSFYITEGEAGEYGFELTLNEGTEFEETKYYYHIPAGEYTITNVGSNRAQVSVLSDEVIVNDAGWEEFAEGFDCVAFEANESGTIHVDNNQCIEITEGGDIRFELN